MAKVWVDAGTFLEKTIDIEDMFELNLRKVRKANESKKIKLKLNESKFKKIRKKTTNDTKSKPIKVFNIETGEVRIFKSAKAASKYLKISGDYASCLARENRVTREGWKAEYIQEVSDGISKCGTSN
ncbi:NUMOD1 domain-containing DNA-binding protein [Clostridioides difficile]|uniref:NUMOD1 domain-containing DNA-binding protein n=1 Tax=Clostridioides difficile TaxID=1496 RepID=UPI00097FEFBC|nr:NUMOD1 domain-containing DNA-binding protein [Clostridioides difficile]SJR40696.1 NUMOD1 domain [Clostridioides difficile]